MNRQLVRSYRSQIPQRDPDSKHENAAGDEGLPTSMNIRTTIPKKRLISGILADHARPLWTNDALVKRQDIDLPRIPGSLLDRDHLFDRLRDRKISVEDLYQLKL